MFQSDRKPALLAAIGAVLLSATCVLAAAGPVQAADSRPALTALRY